MVLAKIVASDCFVLISKRLSKDIYACVSLQNKCWTADPDRQNLGSSGKFSFFTIYKFWQNCALVQQVADLILKTAVCKYCWLHNSKKYTYYQTLL